MPKAAEFKIVKMEGRNLPYRLDLPANWSETGKRRRIFFATLKEAEGFAAIARKKRRDGRERETLLPEPIRLQTVAALDLLPNGVSLADAVSTFAKCWHALNATSTADILKAAHSHAATLETRRKSVPFADLLPAFVDAPTKKTKRRKSDGYRGQITGLANRLNPVLGEFLVCDLEAEAIEAAVTKHVPEGSREAAYKVLGAALNMAIAKKWTATNPCEEIEWISADTDEARIPSANQARALLAAADSPEVLAYIALSLFAGTRDSETRRLRWENFLWKSSEIELKAAPGRKAATGRFIRIEDNLKLWLAPLRKPSGLVCGGLDKDAMQVHMKRVRKLADVALVEAKQADDATLSTGWQRDLMRHGAASMWAAIHGIPKACHWLGHSEEVHRMHYRHPVSEADARKFFLIVPKTAPANIVEMTA